MRGIIKDEKITKSLSDFIGTEMRIAQVIPQESGELNLNYRLLGNVYREEELLNLWISHGGTKEEFYDLWTLSTEDDAIPNWHVLTIENVSDLERAGRFFGTGPDTRKRIEFLADVLGDFETFIENMATDKAIA